MLNKDYFHPEPIWQRFDIEPSKNIASISPFCVLLEDFTTKNTWAQSGLLCEPSRALYCGMYNDAPCILLKCFSRINIPEPIEFVCMLIGSKDGTQVQRVHTSSLDCITDSILGFHLEDWKLALNLYESNLLERIYTCLSQSQAIPIIRRLRSSPITYKDIGDIYDSITFKTNSVTNGNTFRSTTDSESWKERKAIYLALCEYRHAEHNGYTIYRTYCEFIDHYITVVEASKGVSKNMIHKNIHGEGSRLKYKLRFRNGLLDYLNLR